MGTILVFLERKKNGIRDASLEVLSMAKEVGEGRGIEVRATIFGEASPLLEDLSRYGAELIYEIKDDKLVEFNSRAYAHVVAQLIEKEKPDILLLSATPKGKELGPRIAAILNLPMASDCIDLSLEDSRVVVRKPLFAGKVIGTFEILAKPAIISIRPKSFELRERKGRGEISQFTPFLKEEWFDVRTLDRKEKEDEREVDVIDADIIVSGGRGVGGAEGFEPLKELVQSIAKLGVGKVGLGASRAAVDAGWIDHSHQVGQTGKVVSPKLYIACGISGAIQHLAGMRTSKVIVAINKDREAPIFGIADYGIVGDLFEIVPLLKEKIEEEAKRKS